MAKHKIFDSLINLLFPKDLTCIVCGDELPTYTKYGVCDSCMQMLPFITENICLRCGEPIDDLSKYCNRCKNKQVKFFTLARAPLVYENEVVKLIHNFKFNSVKYLAEYLSNFLIDEFIKLNWQVDIVVPVPVSKKRLKQRGYNQTELIAKPLCEKFNLTLNTTNLLKHKETLPQMELSGAERSENLIDAFMVVDKILFKNKNILLIDDVYTTGATMEEIARTLLKSGANTVYCLTLAHTKPPKDLE